MTSQVYAFSTQLDENRGYLDAQTYEGSSGRHPELAKELGCLTHPQRDREGPHEREARAHIAEIYFVSTMGKG